MSILTECLQVIAKILRHCSTKQHLCLQIRESKEALQWNFVNIKFIFFLESKLSTSFQLCYKEEQVNIQDKIGK